MVTVKGDISPKNRVGRSVKIADSQLVYGHTCDLGIGQISESELDFGQEIGS